MEHSCCVLDAEPPHDPIPASLITFQRLLPNEDACTRWPDGFQCPARDHGWQLKTDGWSGGNAIPEDRHLPSVIGDRPARKTSSWTHAAFPALFQQARSTQPHPCDILIKSEPSA